MNKMLVKTAGLFGLATACLPAASSAAPIAPNVIENFGALRTDNAHVGDSPDPSLRYRVAFEITHASTNPGEVNPALDRLARFVNLLGAAGIRPAAGDLVAVIRGPATTSILSEDAYQDRFHRKNPDAELIQALIRAGVAVHVCNYALGNQKIERDEVASGVQVDLAAMMTLATLQLKGWVVVNG